MTPFKLGRVVFWMMGALLSFSVQAVAIRALAKHLNIFEVLSIRSSSGIVILVAVLALRPELRRDLAWRHMGQHFIRNSTHFLGQYAWALAVTVLPFATVFSLEFTTPAWVALFATLFLGERMTRSRAGSVALGFLGVLVIVRPGLASFQPMALVVLGAAVCFATSLIVTKKLTANVSTFAIVFWMNLMQFPMALVGSDPSFPLRLGSDAILPAVGLGIVGLTSHFCLTQAFRSGDATVVVPLDFLRIPLIAMVGWMFYGEALDGFVFAGASLIIGGVLWNLRAESRRHVVPIGLGAEKAAVPEA